MYVVIQCLAVLKESYILLARRDKATQGLGRHPTSNRRAPSGWGSVWPLAVTHLWWSQHYQSTPRETVECSVDGDVLATMPITEEIRSYGTYMCYTRQAN